METFSVEITRCSKRNKYVKNVAFGKFLNLYKFFPKCYWFKDIITYFMQQMFRSCYSTWKFISFW